MNTHHAGSYLATQVYSPPRTPTSHPIAAHEVLALRKALEDDSVGYLHSAIVSVSDAIRGISEGFYSWGVVKLYYATFYACRAMLSQKGRCVFYQPRANGASPFVLKCGPGEIAKKGAGTTHKLILGLFSGSNILPEINTQTIDSEKPLHWMMLRREEVNYSYGTFSEPDIPRVFEKIVSGGLRKVISASLQNDSIRYDSDYAIISFPLFLVGQALLGTDKSRLDFEYYNKSLRDSDGPIAPMLALLRQSRPNT